MQKVLRVAVIGDTGRGNYGHGLDLAFHQVAGAQVVAVADPDEVGRERAQKRTSATNAYADYRQMLSSESLDVVCVAPSWHSHREEMVVAVAEAGCHLYCEKPFASTLESADTMAAAIRKARVRLAMAHQWRAMLPVAQVIQEVREGSFGRLLRCYVRPKDDHRGGGEELPLHGTHLFDIVIAMAGMPRWVSGYIQTEGRAIRKQDRRQASHPLGPVAGDEMDAVIGFDRGVRCYFQSTANLAVARDRGFDNLFGLVIECEKSRIQLRPPGDVFVYPAPTVLADLEDIEWKKRWIQDWHFTPEHQPRPLRSRWISIGNKTLAKDLMEAIQQQRDPLSGLEHALAITEICQAVYVSHFESGRRVTIPLKTRKHPLL